MRTLWNTPRGRLPNAAARSDAGDFPSDFSSAKLSNEAAPLPPLELPPLVIEPLDCEFAPAAEPFELLALPPKALPVLIESSRDCPGFAPGASGFAPASAAPLALRPTKMSLRILATFAALPCSSR